MTDRDDALEQIRERHDWLAWALTRRETGLTAYEGKQAHTDRDNLLRLLDAARVELMDQAAAMVLLRAELAEIKSAADSVVFEMDDAAAILALRQWMDAEGLAIVPKEATEKMLQHGLGDFDGYANATDIRFLYRAMITAAPDVLGKP
jgi:hypothetical protein